MIGCSNGKWSLNKICRLCLRHEGAMSSIFTEDTDGIIPRRILYCLSLKVRLTTLHRTCANYFVLCLTFIEHKFVALSCVSVYY
jgi:hypothetical protein